MSCALNNALYSFGAVGIHTASYEEESRAAIVMVDHILSNGGIRLTFAFKN